MKEKEFGVITFKSVNHAMKGESIFSKENIDFRTIPTPREITHSCGISIKFDLKDIDLATNIVGENQLDIKGIFKVIKNDKGSSAKKIH